MQGQRSSIGALPENVFLDNGSISADPIATTQMSLNQNWPGYALPLNPNSFQYAQQPRHGEHNLGFSLGESSSSAAARHQVDHSGERKPEDTWNFSSQTILSFENQRQFEPTHTLSLDNNGAEINLNNNQTTSTITSWRFSLQNPVSNALPQDLNTSSGLEEDDDCQVIEHPKVYNSTRSSNEQMHTIGNSSNSLSLPSSLESQHTSRKRKAIEINAGQSSGEGSSNYFESGGTSQWQSQMASSNTNMSLPRQRGIITIGDGSEPANSRLRLGVGQEAISYVPVPLSASLNADNARMNPHLCTNWSPQQTLQPPNSSDPNVGNVRASSSRHSSRSVRNNRFLNLNPAPVVENVNIQAQTFSFHLPPPVHSDPPSRLGLASNRRYGSSSMAEESNPTMLEQSAARNVARNISEHPMFLPAPEIGNLNEIPANLSWGGGNIMTGPGNVASSSRAGPSRAPHLSETGLAHRASPQNPRRLSDFVRRSLLPSAGVDSAGQSGTNGARSNASSGLANLGHRARSALLERRLNAAAVGFSRSLRNLAAGDEGRNNVMPEHVRRIMDIMRRGERLRFEDMLILDQSAFFAMADIHDRHRDMRMDVDNMSYEELLALEERIGNVCTGLTEENIMKHMKQRKYVNYLARDQNETEPCSICREEYNEGEDVGTLECGHDFHRDCIKQWLMQKNLCPICKTTGLNI